MRAHLFILVLAGFVLFDPALARAQPYGLPCELTPEDIRSLANPRTEVNRQKYTPQTFASIPDDAKKNLCTARRLVRRVKEAGGAAADHLTYDDIPLGLSRYVTEEEYRVVGPVVRRFMVREMQKKGIGR